MLEVMTLEQLQKFLMVHFDLRPEQVTESARLVEDLELDSLDTVDLLVWLEQETRVEIAEGELKSMETVQDVLQVLRRKLETYRGPQP
jgi:acyl carrier protein